jgi:hypothetical protein
MHTPLPRWVNRVDFGRSGHVCFPPDLDRCADILDQPLWAKPASRAAKRREEIAPILPIALKRPEAEV